MKTNGYVIEVVMGIMLHDWIYGHGNWYVICIGIFIWMNIWYVMLWIEHYVYANTCMYTYKRVRNGMVLG